MNVSSLFRPFFLVSAALTLALGASACGDDPVAAPEPTGNAKVTVMHANTDITSNVTFKLDTTTLATLGFGAVSNVDVRNGGRTLTINTASGTKLSQSSVTLDTTTKTSIIFTGTLQSPESFAVTTKTITPTATGAGIRVINASNNVGKIVLKLNNINGSPLSSGSIDYKANTPYYEVAVATTNLIVVKESAATTQVLDIPLTSALTAGKNYTLVIYGSADAGADPSVKLASKLIAD